MIKHYECIVSDYEHSGDLDWARSFLLKICPHATNIKTWEEEDYEQESDYEEEYGELDEPIYQGYISFDAPQEEGDKVRL